MPDCGSTSAAKTTKDLPQAVRFCYDEFFPYVYFFVHYSMRGSAFYFAKEWEETEGLLSDRKGRVVAYNEDRPDILDGRSTRLAADVEKLRKTELEWPADKLTFDRAYTRELIRGSELLDEPGRGPLLRVLTKLQEQHRTDFVPTAAMALQGLRRVWAEYGEGLQEEDPGRLESATGFVLGDNEEKEAERPELPDPQLAFQKDDDDFTDYEAGEVYY